MDSCRSEYDGLLFPPETVYGYPTRELVFFALMCRRHEISEKDLHDFCLGAENGWRCGYDDLLRTLKIGIASEMKNGNVKASATGEIPCGMFGKGGDG